jgi:hypothetical protein
MLKESVPRTESISIADIEHTSCGDVGAQQSADHANGHVLTLKFIYMISMAGLYIKYSAMTRCKLVSMAAILSANLRGYLEKGNSIVDAN